MPFATITCFINDVSALCIQNKVKVKSVRMLIVMFFLNPIKDFKKVIKNQGATIKGNKFKFLYIDKHLSSSFAHGRGGGGGHGNSNWVVRHFENASRWMNIQNYFLKNSILI
ncbi:MAG: hypothetical protein WCJ62_00745 [Flavobacterium sp.]